MNKRTLKQDAKEELPLSKAAEYLIEECRMILPGIQALFGFQLVVVFNATFAEKLTLFEQRLHLVAIASIGLAIIIIMTPAAYHRQTGPQDITQRFINLSTRLMLFSMVPLAFSICVELYLISHVILHSILLPLLITLALFVVLIVLWFLLPHSKIVKRVLGGES